MTIPTRYIINDPELKTPLRRRTEWTVTFVAWAIWVYFVVPLATLILWIVGVRLIVLEQFMLDHMEGLATVMGWYLVGAIAIGAAFWLWSRYNLWRFGGEDRRRHADPVTDDDLSEHISEGGISLAEARGAKRILVTQDEHNRFALSVEDT
jgi:poly-beta-1,6-N-acetyl-D-glucosamine biosynthesis protein PgaD